MLFSRFADRSIGPAGGSSSRPPGLLHRVSLRRVSALLLTLDLTRPLRFWHMLIESNTFQPMFKYWSPMSVGSWALLIFGIFAFISFLAALVEDNRIGMASGAQSSSAGNAGQSDCRGRRAFWLLRRRLHRSATCGDQPPHLVGHASARHAVYRFGRIHIGGVDDSLCEEDTGGQCPVLAALHRIDAWVIALEFVVLIAVMISLGPVFRAWLSAWGLLLFFGVIVIGMLIPLALYWRRQWLGDRNVITAAALVLIGGFILRLVIVFSAQGV